jgi:hypothetical protein
MDDTSDDMNDMIQINNLIIYLEQCIVNNKNQQAKFTIDRIIRLFQLLKFNLDISDN